MIDCPRCDGSLGSALRAKVKQIRNGGNAQAWHSYGKRFCVLCRAELVVPEAMAVEYALLGGNRAADHDPLFSVVCIALRVQHGLPSD